MLTRDNRREPLSGSLEEILANPDFLAQATAIARRDARGTRLAVILQTARSHAAELSVVERPVEVLHVPFGPTPSAAETFTTIATLLFVPWAHGDCSQRVLELQRTGEAFRPGSSPVAVLYEAVALDVRARQRSSGTAAMVSLRQKKLEMALEDYTRALTGWMRAVLG